MNNPAFQFARNMDQVELENLKKNRNLCDPSMHESIDARIKELEERISLDFVPIRVKLQKIERL